MLVINDTCQFRCDVVVQAVRKIGLDGVIAINAMASLSNLMQLAYLALALAECEEGVRGTRHGKLKILPRQLVFHSWMVKARRCASENLSVGSENL